MTSPAQDGHAITDSPQAGKVALTFFFGLMEKWGCSTAEQKVLLGSVGNTTYRKYKSLPEMRLSHDLMERISYFMGIHKSLRIIFSNQVDNAYLWVSKPNQAAPFKGQSALQFMLSGRMTELSDVRRYLHRVAFELPSTTNSISHCEIAPNFTTTSTHIRLSQRS